MLKIVTVQDIRWEKSVCIYKYSASRTPEQLSHWLLWDLRVGHPGLMAKDQATEAVPTRHGYAVMLWDHAGQDWSEVTCCPTPEELFDKLLDAATGYQEYLKRREALK